MWHELPENRPPIRDGYMEASEKPGFGLAYNHEIIDIYRGDVARSLP
jgi:L-alanine-DL-glutamate epimerase-like enolase superfamily enzyme